jgi:hypothetical protein
LWWVVSMPIRGLQEFLSERKLLQTGQVATLAHTRLGIEGTNWLKKITINEPFQVATGGAPLTLVHTLETELDKFKKAQVKPFFVFSGLSLVKKDRPFTSGSDSRALIRSSAWEAYYNGEIAEAAALFESAEKHISLNFLSEVFLYFHEHGVEFMRAPYFSWPQLAWLADSKQGHVQTVYGGLELLLFGVSRIVLNIDFEKGTFEWVDHATILRELNMNQDQFIDSCILAGFDLCLTFPPLLDALFSFRAAYEMVKAYGSGRIAVETHSNHPQVQNSNYIELYIRTKNIIRHHLVFTTNCICEPLNKQTCPSDLHELIGPRLPNALYFLLCQGGTLPQVINNLLSGALLEAPPLVDSEEYKHMISSLIDIRSKTLAILTLFLHESFKRRKVVTIRWFDPLNEYELDHNYRPDIIMHLKCYVRYADIMNQLKVNNISPKDIGLSFVIQMLLDLGPPDLTVYDEPVFTQEEMIVAILLQGLEIRGYLAPDRQVKALGRALSLVDRKYAEEVFVIIELLMKGQLHSAPLRTPQRRPLLEAHSSQAKEISLISRVVSLLSMSYHGDKPWSGPIDHELMGFSSIVKALLRSLRNLTEMLAAHLVITHKARFAPEGYTDVLFRLPFLRESSTAMGVVIKYYLLGDDMLALESKFPACKDITGDLKNAFTFWDQVMRVINFLYECQAISVQLFEEFVSADMVMRSPA